MATVSLKNAISDYFGGSDKEYYGTGGGGGGAPAGVAIGAGITALAGLGGGYKKKWYPELIGTKADTIPNYPEIPSNGQDGTKEETQQPDLIIAPNIPSDLEINNKLEIPKVNPETDVDISTDFKKPSLDIPPNTGNEENSGIKDKTFENWETAFDMTSLIEFLEADRNARWEREDAIRAETQAREDNAYQRAIDDMQKAGINPNLLGSITPAAAGGGITNQAGLDMGALQTELMNQTDLIEKMLDMQFKEDENSKDRWTSIIASFGQIMANLAIAKFLKK